MKQRRPWLYYLMVWVSGGLFLLAWPFLMARDMNDASRNYVPRLGVLTIVYCTTFILYIGMVAYEVHRFATHTMKVGQPYHVTSDSYFALLLVLVFLLFALPAYLVSKTAEFVRARGRFGLGRFLSVALFICHGISLPILQSKLNEQWRAEPNTAVNPDAAP
jgi:DMSO reductase anchor subunit